jgi:hypothetical protein
MTNVFVPFGFRPYRHIDGNRPTMGFETFRIASSDNSVIFTGDPVVGAVAAGLGAFPNYGHYITGSSVATAGGSSIATVGIFAGCTFYNPGAGTYPLGLRSSLDSIGEDRRKSFPTKP